jgi:AcrR family transcriptional regulator
MSSRPGSCCSLAERSAGGSGAAEPAEARPGGRRGPETREAIDAAALELFARLGYHATSVRAIAAAAEVQPAAIYHWYEGKEAILARLQDDFMDRLTDDVEAAIAGHADPALRLAAAVRAHVVFHGLHRRAAFVTDSEIRALEPERRAALVARRDAYQARFGEMIRDGIRDGSLRASETQVATYAILLQCTGVALWFDPDGPLGLDQVAEVHVELVLASLRASGELIAEAIESVSRRPPAEARAS